MNRTKTVKTIYPIVAAVLSFCGTGALLFGLYGLWLPLCLAANVFWAAGMVGGTEVKTVRKKNPLAQFSEDEPEEVEHRMYRVPILSVILALVNALATGLVFGSAVAGLAVLFTWGGLGIPLAMCILYRSDFGLSMQTGLISSIVLTGIAGVIQIFISSPGHTFDPEYCFDLLASRMKETLTEALAELQTLAQGQTVTLSDGSPLSELLGTVTAEETVNGAVTTFLSMTPALFAIGILAMLCVIWWGTKEALKRSPDVEVKYMGRLDGYNPGRILPAVYLLFFLVNLFSQPGSAMQIAAMNIVSVASAVLTYAGFSILLYIINTRARSVAARVLLIIATVAVSMSSCGGSLLLLLGILSAGRDFRSTFGGGNYQ